MRARFIASLLLFAGLVCPAHDARAHAMLLETTPKDGAVVETGPAEIILRFNEPVAPVFVRLIGAQGTVAVPDPPRAAGHEIRLRLAHALANGGYLVSWRTVSADSHPVAGSFAFSVGGLAHTPAVQQETADDSGWRTAKIIARLIQDAALLIAAGGILFGVLVLRGTEVPTGASYVVAVAGIAAVTSAVALVGVQGGVLSPGSASILIDASTWRLGFSTPVGTGAAALCLALAVVGVGWRWHIRWLAAAGAVGATASLALSGHSAASPWPTQLALAAHVTCGAYWFGSFVPLYAILRHTPVDVAAALVQRFSTFAVPAVALLAACSVCVAISRIDDIDLVFASAYGELLAAKSALVLALLGVAAVNRGRVTPLLAQGSTAAARTLRRNIAIEMGLGLAILAATAILAHTPPPATELHSIHDHSDPSVDEGKSMAAGNRGRVAIVTVAPGRVGANAVTVELRGPDAGPLSPLEVRVAVSSPAAGIEPLERLAVPAGPARYRLERVDLPLSGRWLVRVDALITDFEKASFEVEIAIE